MIIGVDIGNSTVKTSTGVIFSSKLVKRRNTLSNSDLVTINGESYVIGEGDYDTEYRKAHKESYIPLLFTALCKSTKEITVRVVLGLPIEQFINDSETLRKRIVLNKSLRGTFNGEVREFYIADVEVFPEGLSAVDDSFEGIVVDIGGRTTDCCLITNNYGKRQIEKPISLPIGTLNLYSEFIKAINQEYQLDLTINDTERIIQNGLSIYGEKKDISFALDTFKSFLDETLIKRLNLEYSIKTNNLIFIGGGSIILRNSIQSRLKNASIIENGLFANVLGFKELGEAIWI